MKRNTLKIVVFLCVFIVLSAKISAVESFDLNDFKLPENAENAMEEPLSEENLAEIFSFQSAIKFISNAFISAFGERFEFIAEIFAVLFAIYLINTISSSFFSSNLISVMSFITVSIAAISLFYEIFKTSNELVSAYLQLAGFLTALIPTFLSALATAGYGGTSVAAGATLFFVMESFSVFISGGLVPFVNTYLCVGSAAGISENTNLKAISSFIRNAAVTITALIMTIFSGIMSIQTTLAMTGDTLTKRAAKLAAGTFIPVFGGAVGEGLETAFASGLFLKNTVGAFGTAVIFLTLLTPIVKIAVDLLIVSIVCSICKFFENTAVNSFFSVTRDCLIILLAVSCTIMIMLLVGLSILMKI